MSIETRLAELESLVKGAHGAAARTSALEQRASHHEQVHNSLRASIDDLTERVEAVEAKHKKLKADIAVIHSDFMTTAQWETLIRHGVDGWNEVQGLKPLVGGLDVRLRRVEKELGNPEAA